MEITQVFSDSYFSNLSVTMFLTMDYGKAVDLSSCFPASDVRLQCTIPAGKICLQIPGDKSVHVVIISLTYHCRKS